MSYKYDDSQHEVQRLKGAQTSMVWTSCFSFTTSKRSAQLDANFWNGIWFLHFDVSLPITNEWGGAKWKHTAIANNFVKAFTFVIMDQTTWNCFSTLMLCFFNK